MFADTGHEHTATYEYVALLPSRTGGPDVQWVQADFTEKFAQRRANIRKKWSRTHTNYPHGVPQDIIERALAVMHPTGDRFLDLCLLRGGFPSAVQRYCTDRLKIKPVFHQVIEPISEEYAVCQWLGIRRDESRRRREALRVEARSVKDVDFWLYRPLLEWSVEDVLALYRRHKLPLNPLYLKGASRVGCWPCIHARKEEIQLVANLTPDAIAKLEEWEEIVNQASKSGCATFFCAKNVTQDGEPFDHKKHGIRAQVEWAKTTRGGKQYPLFAPGPTAIQHAWASVPACEGGYCE